MMFLISSMFSIVHSMRYDIATLFVQAQPTHGSIAAAGTQPAADFYEYKEYMRVVLNGMFWRQPTVGSGQYVHGLLEGLQQIEPEHEYVLLLPAFQDDERWTNSVESTVYRQPSIVSVQT